MHANFGVPELIDLNNTPVKRKVASALNDCANREVIDDLRGKVTGPGLGSQLGNRLDTSDDQKVQTDLQNIRR